MVSGYFEDMSLVLMELWRVMKVGGQAGIVIGNVRFGGLTIPVDALLSMIAEEIGFSLKNILIVRYKQNSPQQMKKYGKKPVRESILIIQK
jgi:DNA modification methylase